MMEHSDKPNNQVTFAYLGDARNNMEVTEDAIEDVFTLEQMVKAVACLIFFTSQ